MKTDRAQIPILVGGRDVMPLCDVLNILYYGALDAAADTSLPDEEEFDITVAYRVQHGPLRGIWFRVRNGYVDFDRKGRSVNNVRIIINYELPVL